MTTPQQLSLEDIAALVKNPSAATRATLAEKIAHHIDNGEKGQKEWRLAVDIAYLLLKDQEQAVRVALSDSIKNSVVAPKELIVALANDVSDEVAAPVLRESEQLSDEELMNIIETTHRMIRLMAMAKRKRISTRLVSALLYKKVEEVTRTVVENPGADITEPQFMQIAEDYYDSQQMMQSFMAHKPVPVKAVKHMVEVSTSISKQKIMTNRDRALVESENAASNTVVDEIRLMITLGSKPTQNNCMQLAERFNRSGSLTPIFLSGMLMLGNNELFIASMACRSRVPLEHMEKLYNGDEQQFREFFDKARLPYGMLRLFQYQRRSAQEIMLAGFRPNNHDFLTHAAEKMSEAIEANIPYANRIGYAAMKMLSDFYANNPKK